MMTKTFDVRVWDLRKRQRADRAVVRYEVRWAVDGRSFSRTFEKKAQADAYRSDLISATNRGEAFDVSTGQPLSSGRTGGPSCYDVARELVAKEWPHAAGNSRRTMCEVFAHLLPLLVPPKREAPAGLTQALHKVGLHKDKTPDVRQRDALRWLEGASLPITAVDETVVKAVLDKAAIGPNGERYSASYVGKRRTYLSKLFSYAVDAGYIEANPVKKVKRARVASAKVRERVTRREIGDIKLARKLLAAIDNEERRAFLSTILLAGCRPSEVAALRSKDMTLPEKGWGELRLQRSASTAGKDWTDSGTERDDRGLKHRAEDDERVVPIPPELVAILRKQLGDRTGLVFPGRKPDQPIGSSAVNVAWREARAAVIPGDDVTLSGPYSLRHLCASTWLNAGVPVIECAERLGHDPAVLLRTYGHLIESDRGRWNNVIEAALGAS